MYFYISIRDNFFFKSIKKNIRKYLYYERLCELPYVEGFVFVKITLNVQKYQNLHIKTNYTSYTKSETTDFFLILRFSVITHFFFNQRLDSHSCVRTDTISTDNEN